MRWPPFEHVFFDCDSTLTAVEGIDWLAERAGKGADVRALTRAAMEGEAELRDVYGERLDLISATWAEVQAVRQAYKKHAVEDAAAVISALHALGHRVYIVSGGLLDPVREFGVYLGVPPERVRAVELDYDQLSGRWWSRIGEHPQPDRRYLAYRAGALAVSDGKAHIVRELRGAAPGRSLLVGDGASDLLARHAVDLFVGFGGVAVRERVVAEAPVFVRSTSLAPVLVLAAGPGPVARLGEPYRTLADKALALARGGAIEIREPALARKLDEACAAARRCEARHPA